MSGNKGLIILALCRFTARSVRVPILRCAWPHRARVPLV